MIFPLQGALGPVGRSPKVSAAAPGGPAPPQADLVHWFRPDLATLWQDSSGTTAVAADGDPIGKWSSKVGAVTATQATSGARPVYKTGGQNGLAYLKFGPTSQFLNLGNLSALFPTAASLYAMYDPRNDGGYNIYTTRLDGSGADGWWRYEGGTQGYPDCFRSTRVESWPETMPNDSAAHDVAVISSAATYRIVVDGVDRGTQPPAYAAGTNHQIGKFPFNQVGGIYNGRIYELIAYSVAHDTDQRAAVQAYLVDRYGHR